MFHMSVSWWEPIIRALIIYVALFVMFRLAGKKQLGEMSPFDFILLLIISESVSNGLTGDDSSLPAGVICAAALVGLSSAVDRVTFHSKKAEKIIEGEPRILIANGHLSQKRLDAEKITLSELEESMRSHGIRSLDQVRYAVLETNGKISYIRKDDLPAETEL